MWESCESQVFLGGDSQMSASDASFRTTVHPPKDGVVLNYAAPKKSSLKK